MSDTKKIAAFLLYMAEHERPVVNRMLGLRVFADLVSLAEHEFAGMSVEERDKFKKPEYTMSEAEIYVEERLRHMREVFAEALEEAEYQAEYYKQRFDAVREAVEKA
jgi:predicted naringenin-chalcone synthase